MAENREMKQDTHCCFHCKKRFAAITLLKRHIRCHNRQKKFSCRYCSKPFFTKTSLKNHERTHTGEKPFRCELCQRCFALKIQLSSHKRLHTGERPFVCDYCGKSFSRRETLHTHIGIHTKKKTFVCIYCQKAFIFKRELDSHLRVHTGEKPFTCNHCNKTFSQKNSLKRHIMQMHSRKTPYLCTHCGRSFKLLAGLKIHAHRLKIKQVFKCLDCRKVFCHKDGLENHFCLKSKNLMCNINNFKRPNLVNTCDVKLISDHVKKCVVVNDTNRIGCACYLLFSYILGEDIVLSIGFHKRSFNLILIDLLVCTDLPKNVVTKYDVHCCLLMLFAKMLSDTWHEYLCCFSLEEMISDTLTILNQLCNRKN